MAAHPVNVEKYRQRFESDEHWRYRRDFILRHYGSFAENRLLCLSQVFINVQLLGCRYPEPVMCQIRELTKDTEQPARKKVPKFRVVPFVKASGSGCSEPQAVPSYQGAPNVDSAPARMAGLGCGKRGRDVDVSSISGPPAKVNKGSCSSTEEPPSPEIRALLATFDRVGALARSGSVPGATVLERLHEASQKTKTTLSFDIVATSSGYKCSVFLNRVWLAEGAARSKKGSRLCAYEVAWEKIKGQRHKINVNPAAGGRLELHSEAGAGDGVEDHHVGQHARSDHVVDSTAQRLLNIKLSLPNFVLVEVINSCKDSASNALFLSASLNKVSCKYSFTTDRSHCIVCMIILNGCEVGKGTGENRQVAKQEASKEALTLLQTIVPTVRIKSLVDSCGQELTKEMMGSAKNSATIPENNVGHKLLTMMGWCGGGIGKDGSGMVDPIMPMETVKRAGLGFTQDKRKLGPAFKNKVQTVLKGFASKVVLKDLVFAPEFDNEERKYIHEAARRLGLKSISRNGPDGRFLTVRHKLSPGRLLEEVLRLGSTDKYEVVMPTRVAM